MAPSTRLRSNPELRVHYGEGSQSGSRGNSIVVEGVAMPTIITRRLLKPMTAAVPRGTRTARVKAGAVTKPIAAPKQAKRSASKPKTKERPTKQDCSICATEKCTSRSFRVPVDANTCDHLETICVSCIQKMLKTKVTERQLATVELACPFPNCDHALDLSVLKKVVSKAVYEYYDQALLKHLLSADKFYISCLSETCGLYFSIEDCGNPTSLKGNTKKASKQNVACPYCDSEICLKCSRPWESHASGDCSKAKAAEDQESEKTLKVIGAKPCPGCGINIQKEFGCDHMQCQRCHHHFCWQCLVPYNSNVRHAEHCPHARINAAADPRNWVADEINLNQLNNLIQQGIRLFNNPRAPPPGAPRPAPLGVFGQPPNMPPPPGFAPPPGQPAGLPNAVLNFLGLTGNNNVPPPPPAPAPPPPQPPQAPQAPQPPRAHGIMQTIRREGHRVAFADLARRLSHRG